MEAGPSGREPRQTAEAEGREQGLDPGYGGSAEAAGVELAAGDGARSRTRPRLRG